MDNDIGLERELSERSLVQSKLIPKEWDADEPLFGSYGSHVMKLDAGGFDAPGTRWGQRISL